MLETYDIIDEQEMIQQFTKSFKNFCEKSPLFITATVSNGKVYVKDSNQDQPMVFDLDFRLDYKTNIKYIKDQLIEDYPILYKQTEEELGSDEIEKLVADGMPLRQALDQRRVTKLEKKYKIIKTLNLDNNIIVEDINSGKLSLYYLRVPLIYFMQEVYANIENASDIFENKSKFIKGL